MAFRSMGPKPFPGSQSYQAPIARTMSAPQPNKPLTLPAGVVHRQFNSPLNLYSTEAVAETLNKQAQVLSNGAVGIDFRYLAAPNLAKSEVLKMLEAEEQTWQGPGLKRVAWPPPPENQVITAQAEEPTNYQAPIQNGTGQRPWENGLSNNYHHSEEQPHYQQPVKPVYAPRPVLSPPPPPPPSTVTLRTQPPISQPSPPVFISQPAVKRQEPIRMRGDQKWPPAQYKEAKEAEKQAAEEAAARARAAGKPRRVNKDYSSFFAQNALLPTYPGYKAPPGTQHYEEVGTSNL
ncbi:cell division protein ZipA-like [Ischnura elegans]|uniref:cell division protein ZipA-like n=1 Tax=Ischnura elegans TaxID=197161 RepID=UPI001ED893A3|nr:cell division protein ZipA-like [Ischnura elegans]